MFEIGWIDFSNKDRERAKRLLSFIKPEGQLDELGVGYIRDALSNQIFPGISTIQTRAKYFFVVTNILRDFGKLNPLEKRKTNGKKYLNIFEHEVKNKLRALYQSKEGLGIIGVTLKDRQQVKRNASEIYWNGLRTYRFLENEGLSLLQFLKNFSTNNSLQRSVTDDEQDDMIAIEELERIKTPIDNDWFQNLQLSLTEDEQSFFKSQILNPYALQPYSLLIVLMKNEELREMFLEASTFQNFVQQSLDIDYNSQVKKTLILAHDFACLMEGVHLLYNHILQRHLFNNDYSGYFLDIYLDWRTDLEQIMIDFELFSPLELYRHTKYSRKGTEIFISAWWDYIKNSDPKTLPPKSIMQMIENRERLSKGKKSRLSKPASANVDIEIEKRVGLSLFQYRFFNAKTIVKDIFQEPQIEFRKDAAS